MTKEQDLVKLENIVENLILRFNVLKQENNELTAQLQAKEEKINELQVQVDSLNENTSEVKGRVSSLIDSIEDWEKSLLAEDQAVPGSAKLKAQTIGGTKDQGESQLFSVVE